MRVELDFNPLILNFKLQERIMTAEKEVIAMETDTVITRLAGIHKEDNINQIETVEKMRNGV